MEAVIINLSETASSLETILSGFLETPMPSDRNFKDFVFKVIYKSLDLILNLHIANTEYAQVSYIDAQRLLNQEIADYLGLGLSNHESVSEIYLNVETSLLSTLQGFLPFFTEWPMIVTQWTLNEFFDFYLMYELSP